MMYCSLEDLQARFGASEVLELTDRGNDDIEDAQVFEQASADTDALIDSYLAGRYRLPLQPIPAPLVLIACDICRYLLWEDKVPPTVEKRYEAALAQLRDFAKGVRVLPGAVLSTDPSVTGQVVVSAPERMFSIQTLGGF